MLRHGMLFIYYYFFCPDIAQNVPIASRINIAQIRVAKPTAILCLRSGYSENFRHSLLASDEIGKEQMP